MSYSNDRQFELKFMPQTKVILGQYLLTRDFKEDVCNCTDLFVLKTDTNKRIVVRGRRYDAFCRYPDDFTIRFMRDSGAETEFMKVMSGLGDIMFYYFVDKNEKNIIKWFIGDLNVFRKFITNNLRDYGEDFLDRHCHSNHDGTYLLAFNHMLELPGFVIESSWGENWECYNGIWWQIRENTGLVGLI